MDNDDDQHHHHHHHQEQSSHMLRDTRVQVQHMLLGYYVLYCLGPVKTRHYII